MLEALEAFGPAAFFRTSIVLYPIVNVTHVLAIGALVTTALLMDLRILGLGRKVPVDIAVHYLRPVAAGALVVAILTGLTLFSVQPVAYFGNSAFQVKMLLLAGAILNALAFTTSRAHRRPDSASARAMAMLSIGLWISVAIAGRFIGFLE